MNIGFNLLGVGMGNNGGTRTLLLCTDAINKIGHKAYMLSYQDSFTWFHHKLPLKRIPKNLDAIIAASCHDVYTTVNSSIPKKVWYIRGYETWLYNESKLKYLYDIPDICNIVNSNGLKLKLEKLGCRSIVVYQGIDIHLWNDMRIRRSDKIRIGCLYQKKSTKRWKDFVQLHNILGTDRYEYVAFGASKRNDSFLTKYLLSPSIDDLNSLYSSCHIWFAPTELEGLHNVPMEANLCGCLIVCSNADLNGMIHDYAFDGKTAMVYNQRDIEHAAKLIKSADWSLVGSMQKCIINDICDRETAMYKFVRVIEDIG